MSDQSGDRCRTCCNYNVFLPDELSPASIGTHHDKPLLFVTTQWTERQGWYVAYRILVAGVLLCWGIYDYILETMVFYAPRYGLWFAFATDWAFIVLIITSVYSAILVSCNQCNGQYTEPKDTHGLAALDTNGETEERRFPVRLHIFWLLNTISTSGILAISFSFWTFILALDNQPFLDTPSSKAKHSVAAIVVILDLLISSVPVRLIHVIYPVIAGLLYVAFTVIYYVLGGRGPDDSSAIYPVLAWQSPSEALMTVGLEELLICLLHIAGYYLHRLRICLQASCLPRTRQMCGCRDDEVYLRLMGSNSNECYTESSDHQGTAGTSCDN